MNYCINKLAIFLFLLLTVIGHISSVISETDGSIWINEEDNWKIEFQTGQNYSYSDIEVYNDTVKLQNKNISIDANTSEMVNTTLHQYDLSNPSIGDILIKIEVDAPADENLKLEFSGIPSINSEKYVMVSEKRYEVFETGGIVSWTNSQWGQKKNFSLKYVEKENDSDIDAGINQEESSSSDAGSGKEDSVTTSPAVPDSNNSESAKGSKIFSERFEENSALNNIKIVSENNLSNLDITASLENNSKFPRINNSYKTYKINVSASDKEISMAEIDFKVKKSFANKYNRIKLVRYDEDWIELPTKLVEVKNDSEIYKANSTSFSYYSIIGKDEKDSDENFTVKEAQELLNQAREKVGEEEPGYETLQKAETAFEEQKIKQANKLARQSIKENSKNSSNYLEIVLIIISIALFLITAYKSRRYYLKYKN